MLNLLGTLGNHGVRDRPEARGAIVPLAPGPMRTVLQRLGMTLGARRAAQPGEVFLSDLGMTLGARRAAQPGEVFLSDLGTIPMRNVLQRLGMTLGARRGDRRHR